MNLQYVGLPGYTTNNEPPAPLPRIPVDRKKGGKRKKNRQEESKTERGKKK
jgi:hypothetical protein